jgi:YQGE family putative transporter
MKPVTRLFFITTGWTLAMYSASNFVGAWFWDIGTGIRPILLFYTILFVVMVASFGSAARIRGHLSSRAMMTLGIVLNAVYLVLLLILKTKTRQYFIPLAVLDGLASSFYWLALFVLASTWVKENQASWYNSWTGAIEAVLGLVAPPVAGWVIQAMPGLNGYRVVFFAAFLSLLACTWLVIAARRETAGDPPAAGPAPRQAISLPPGWRRLTWAFWALGMRDGMYFFVPNLLLYIVTHSTVLLGAFSSMQAAIQGVVFWGLTRTGKRWGGRTGLAAATLVSLSALGLVAVALNAVVLFALGAAIALSYPSFKVLLETSALTAITRHGRTEQERTQLTGLKEVWINGGRLFSLLFLLVLLSLLGPLNIPDFRWILGLWSLVPVGMYVLARGLKSTAAASDP